MSHGNPVIKQHVISSSHPHERRNLILCVLSPAFAVTVNPQHALSLVVVIVLPAGTTTDFVEIIYPLASILDITSFDVIDACLMAGVAVEEMGGIDMAAVITGCIDVAAISVFKLCSTFRESASTVVSIISTAVKEFSIG
jgi:hypothetical protein